MFASALPAGVSSQAKGDVTRSLMGQAPAAVTGNKQLTSTPNRQPPLCPRPPGLPKHTGGLGGEDSWQCSPHRWKCA